MAKTIEQLKNENIEHAQYEELFENDGSEQSLKDREHIEKYLRDFVKSDGKCIMCENELGGIFGTFVFGITHGEGACRVCGYPVRSRHIIRDEQREIIIDIQNYLMSYHPSGVENT